MRPPAGRPAEWPAHIFYQIVNAKMSKQWAIEDWCNLFKDAGAFNPPFPK